MLICAPLPQGSPPATPGSITSTVELSPGILPTPSSWSEAARSAGKSLAWGEAENARAGILQKASGGGMGWGHSLTPVLERSPAWEGLQWEKVGSLTLGSEFTLCSRRMGSLFCRELSAFGRHGTRSAWDAGMLTMETDGLSSLVLRSAASQGLFCFVLVFLQFPKVYFYSWIFLRRYWDLSPLARMEI